MKHPAAFCSYPKNLSVSRLRAPPYWRRCVTNIYVSRVCVVVCGGACVLCSHFGRCARLCVFYVNVNAKNKISFRRDFALSIFWPPATALSPKPFILILAGTAEKKPENLKTRSDYHFRLWPMSSAVRGTCGFIHWRPA